MAKKVVKVASVTMYYPNRDKVQTELTGDTITTMPLGSPPGTAGTTIYARDRHHEIVAELHVPAGLPFSVTYNEQASPKKAKAEPSSGGLTLTADRLSYCPPGEPPLITVGPEGIVSSAIHVGNRSNHAVQVEKIEDHQGNQGVVVGVPE